MIGTPKTTAKQLFKDHQPSSDTAAVATIAASAKETWVIDWVHFSYDQVMNVVGSLTITINAVTVYVVEIPKDISNSGPHFISFPGGLYGSKNQAVVVTLLADDNGASGMVNVGYH